MKHDYTNLVLHFAIFYQVYGRRLQRELSPAARSRVSHGNDAVNPFVRRCRYLYDGITAQKHLGVNKEWCVFCRDVLFKAALTIASFYFTVELR